MKMNTNVDAHKRKCSAQPTFGLVGTTQNPSGSLKDTSNADGGKIRSVLTLGVNCSIGNRAEGALLQQSRKSRGGGKKGKEK